MEELIQLFETLEKEQQTVRVTFRNGSIYDLVIIAAMHAEEGGDVVADVRQTIRSAGEPAERWQFAAMNVRLAEKGVSPAQ